MNIWDVPIGGRCRNARTGAIYKVVRDERTRLPTVGRTSVRVVECDDGRTQKFWQGIEVQYPLDETR